MASSVQDKSLRRKVDHKQPYYSADGKMIQPMRPGKTAEDKRQGSWASKAERNARQASYREGARSKK